MTYINEALLSFFSFEMDASNRISCAPKLFSCVPKISAVCLKFTAGSTSAPKLKLNFEP